MAARRRPTTTAVVAASGMGVLALALLPEVVSGGPVLVEVVGFVLALSGPVLMLVLLLRHQPAGPTGPEDLADLNRELVVMAAGMLLFFTGLVVFMQR